jgi:hypothetical protein
LSEDFGFRLAKSAKNFFRRNRRSSSALTNRSDDMGENAVSTNDTQRQGAISNLNFPRVRCALSEKACQETV